MKTLHTNNFDDEIAEGDILVDFWATWCQPCYIMVPVFDKLDANTVPVGKVNVDVNPELIERFDVLSIPTTIYFKDGKEVGRAIGVMPEKKLLEKVGFSPD